MINYDQSFVNASQGDFETASGRTHTGQKSRERDVLRQPLQLSGRDIISDEQLFVEGCPYRPAYPGDNEGDPQEDQGAQWV